MVTLLEDLAKDKEKFLAFLQYLIDSGRLTEEEVINLVREQQVFLERKKDLDPQKSSD